jgi:hypothetical protein
MNNRGPRSESGKEASAFNRLTHGLAAVAIVLPSESAAEWETFHEEVRTRFDTEGAVELALASRVAELLWRLRRVVRAEEQSVSVDQMHRSLLVDEDDRKRAKHARSNPPPVNDEVDGQDETQGPLFYARALAIGNASRRFERTLPVLLPDDAALEKIMRYEAHLSRLLKHALHELEALQDRRRGNATPLARIDIT